MCVFLSLKLFFPIEELPGFTGFSRVFLSFPWYYSVLMSLPGSDLVLVGLSGFFLGLTWFDWV